MDKYFPTIKRRRLGQVAKTEPWLLILKDKDPPLELALVQEDEDEATEGGDEFDLLHLEYLEDARDGQPSNFARLLASWSDGSSLRRRCVALILRATRTSDRRLLGNTSLCLLLDENVCELCAFPSGRALNSGGNAGY